MKKTVFILITIIAILLIILLHKNFSTSSKYTKEEVEQLILKGVENFNDMSNVSFEMKAPELTYRYYYKGNKMLVSLYSSNSNSSFSSIIVDSNEGKEYLIRQDIKTITVINTKKFELDKGIQYTLAHHIENQTNFKNTNIREYHYIKDDSIEKKDCILVEEVTFSQENDSYINRNKAFPEEEIYIYWIEKSTGFVVAFAKTLPGQKSFTPDMILTNITFGNVEDSVFELPTTGYRISEFN